ncbi:luciferase family protein [Streptomyces sp. STR69]|uniref:luciferase domain-containing protein n=1 Tax=Streptomyces sp. STR69 TaxID=1796942 RepID=UPI0021C8DD7D|nr:luciferase family protein [Streptomyces sp. STR69]
MTLASRACTQLATWPDLTEAEPSCGVGRALRSAHGEIAHFHSDDDVDLYLTAGTIRRFEDHLRAAAAVQLVPGSPWVTLHLGVPSDVQLLMTLVSLALQTQQARPVPGDAPRAECNDHRSSVRPGENLGGG